MLRVAQALEFCVSETRSQSDKEIYRLECK
jgi:hypothetical protein